MKSFFFQRRYLPLFVTQFLNAFNDNVFKQALIILITYQSFTLWSYNSKQIVSIASFLFTLPYFLFSPQAGILADSYSKSKIMRLIKLLEIFIMIAALIGFASNQIGFLILVLFFMGAQSAFFGPAKLGILPEVMESDELLSANGIFAMGTFVAILLGVAAGGIISKMNSNDPIIIGYILVAIALLGFLTSTLIPKSKTPEKKQKVSLNIPLEIFNNLKFAFQDKMMGRVLILSTWLWFAGNFLLIFIPGYVKDNLKGDESVATAFMASFSIGIAIGSFLCPKMKSYFKNSSEISRFGLKGMIVTNFVALALSFWNSSDSELQNFQAFIHEPMACVILFNFLCLSIFGGIYIVPLQTYIQEFAPQGGCSQLISAMNILQGLVILISAGFLFLLFKFSSNPSLCLGSLLAFSMFTLIYSRNQRISS